MEKGFVLWNGLLEKLAEDDKLENIVLGTGKMARDMQTKLRLFNIKTAPFLVGGANDPENGVKHYESLAHLDNPQNYRFIFCYDVDEFALIIPSLSVVRKLVGTISWNNPRVLSLCSETARGELAGGLYIDTHVQDCYLQNGCAYSVSGYPEDKAAFKIHIFGACIASGTYRFNKYTIPEIMHSKLCEIGFNSVIYSWGQPNSTVADNITLFLRDGQFFKPDLVILFTTMGDLNPVYITKRNPLYVKTGAYAYKSVNNIISLYGPEASNGINHKVNIELMCLAQNKTFLTLSKLLNFSFWNVFHPGSDTLLSDQSKNLLNLSEGYFSRLRKRKDTIINTLNSASVKDYTGAFDHVSDIFSIYADNSHITNKGSEIVAERLSYDVLAEFGDKNKGFAD